MSATTRYWRGRQVVYRLIDSNGRLLYIGRTNNLPRRLDTHRQLAWWYPLVVRTRVQVHPSRASAHHAEEWAIHREQPAFNKVGTSWIGRDHWTDRDWGLFNARHYAERAYARLGAVSA